MAKQQQNGVVTEDSYKITNESSASKVMKDRREHGDEWEDYIADRFQEMGIEPTFIRVKDSLGLRIADYQYQGVWVEAKTFINNAEVAKIEKLFRQLVLQGYKMVIMAEWQPGTKKYAKDVALLRGMGIAVFEGQSQCDSFIIDESIRLNVSKLVKMAIPLSIPFEQLEEHPNNREKNSKNIPTIKASIVQNGFFTQINVVEHQMKEINGVMKMTYMIFEGHTRYYALKDLHDKGYEIPDIACVLVPWVTSKDIDVLHKMLITTNTTYQGWKLKNYITSHKGNLELLGDVDGILSYGLMLKAMNQAKKQKWGEANPIYLFCHTDSLAFDDMAAVKNGSYRITQADYDEQILPILNLMNLITTKDINGKVRTYLGTIIRDIIVDVRVKYNTEPIIKDNFHQFLGYLKMKFISAYDNGQFPTTKETGQAFWKIVYGEYISLRQLGMAGTIHPYKPQSTIMDFA